MLAGRLDCSFALLVGLQLISEDRFVSLVIPLTTIPDMDSLSLVML